MLMTAQKRKVSSDADVAAMLSSILKTEEEIGRSREHFWIVGLNCKNVTQYVELLSIGDSSSAPVSIREVYRMAIGKGVEAVIFGHNHPSGDCSPSDADIALTKELVKAGKILGIKVYDHIIIPNEGNHHFSLSAAGMIK